MKLSVKNFFVKLELEQSYDEDQLYLKKVTIDDDTVRSDFEDGIYNTEWQKKVLQHPHDPTEKLNEKYDKWGIYLLTMANITFNTYLVPWLLLLNKKETSDKIYYAI